MITATQGHNWRQWVLVTSVPLVRLDEPGQVSDRGTGTMLDYSGHRFILSVEHTVTHDARGWAIVVQQDGAGQLEYYRPNAFTYVAEFRRTTVTFRPLDLCIAEVSPELETWYEYRTPLGLFDKRPHHIFQSDSMATPDSDQIYGFSGQVRHEQHGPSTIASEMVVYPGLAYSHTEDDIHHFRLPVPHPGHGAFEGCSGAPIVDLNRKVVTLVVGGNTEKNTIQGIAIQRAIPNFEFLVTRTRET